MWYHHQSHQQQQQFKNGSHLSEDLATVSRIVFLCLLGAHDISKTANCINATVTNCGNRIPRKATHSIQPHPQPVVD